MHRELLRETTTERMCINTGARPPARPHICESSFTFSDHKSVSVKEIYLIVNEENGR